MEVAAGSPAAARRGLEEAVDLTRQSGCWESVAAGLSALARLERTSENLPEDVSRAREANELARSRELSVFDV